MEAVLDNIDFLYLITGVSATLKQLKWDHASFYQHIVK